MKTPVSFRQSAAIGFLAACLSAGPLPLDAQEKPSPNRPGVAPGPASATAPEYTLEIVNGKLSLAQPKVLRTLSKRSGTGEIASVATLISIVDILRDMHPEANIAMSPEIANVKIADLKLRATSLDDELEALRVASGDKFIWLKLGTMAIVDPTTGQPIAQAPSQTSLYSLMPNESKAAVTKHTVEVFNLGPYLQRKGTARDSSIKEIEQIILATLRQIKGDDYGDDAPTYQFHSGANLLIVIGRPEVLELARKVVSALDEQASLGGGFVGVGAGPGGFVPYPQYGRNMETSKARQKIVDKLESTQFDSVPYDNLPLGEVVRHLIDETKKRDPEKKGINFLVDPNSPAPSAVTARVDPVTGLPIAPAPLEAVDIRSIQIKIDPALTNVRLVDVLDAIVKVADRPIRYSITDYAVVFSLAEQNGTVEGGQLPGAPPGRYGNR